MQRPTGDELVTEVLEPEKEGERLLRLQGNSDSAPSTWQQGHPGYLHRVFQFSSREAQDMDFNGK